MNATAQTQTRTMGKAQPARIIAALIALWFAWSVSLIALLVNQLFFHGSAIGPGWTIGILSLAVQAVVFIFVARGATLARVVVVIFLVLAALPLQLIGRLLIAGSFWSASYLAAGLALKAVAVLLLFTPDASKWFASQA